MKERPIFFNTKMVRAIFEGRKTHTRRVVKSKNNILLNQKTRFIREYNNMFNFYVDGSEHYQAIKCPYEVGMHLWVRETWLKADWGYCYRADTINEGEEDRKEDGYKWKPSIFMPRTASRLTLEVTNIRVERIQHISDLDIRKEGIDVILSSDIVEARKELRQEWSMLWDSINEKRGYGWETNSWVWVYEFKKI